MAALEFYPFPLLPGELRDHIWDHSVRPHGFRGVQYFSIFHEEKIPNDYACNLAPRILKHQYHFIGAPLPENVESRPSWNRNRSTYAIDGGLWTACKESRAAMHRRYRPERWSELFDRERSRAKITATRGSRIVCAEWFATNPKKYYHVPATFVVNSDSGYQHFTVLPAQDLIYLQGYPSWESKLYFLRDFMPFSSPRHGFGGFNHLALEFDPSWTIEELSRYERSCVMREEHNLDRSHYDACEALVEAVRNEPYQHATIWLVDPRLRYRNVQIPEAYQNLLKKKLEGNVFEGNGCKYYAVSKWHDSYGYYDAEIADQPGFLSVWDFLYELEETSTRIHAFEERIDEWDVRGLHGIKVLACEKHD